MIVISLTEEQCNLLNIPLNSKLEIEESRRIVPVNVTQSNSFFTLKWKDKDDRGRTMVFKGDNNKFCNFIKSLKVKDNSTLPHSSRGKKYMDIVEDIVNGIDNIIWVWEPHLIGLPCAIN